IGDVNPVDPMIERNPGVLHGGDAFETERNLELALDALDSAPIKRRLEFAAARASAAGHHVTLGEIAFASAVDRGIHRDAERRVAVGDRAGHMIVNPGLVAAHIELEYPSCAWRGFSNLLKARVADRTEHMGDAKLVRGAYH